MFIDKLKTLHYSQSLNQNTNLNDIATSSVPVITPYEQDDLLQVPEDLPTAEPEANTQVPRGLLGMDPTNILPTRTRTRVQFQE
jgi:hypothetical protein